MTDSIRKVQEALIEVQNRFCQYKVTHPVEGSPISVTEEMQHNLEHDTYNTLPLFLMKAFVWGSNADFKAFLPVILEMYAFDFIHLWSRGSLFRQIRWRRFDEWDMQEQDSIHQFCKVLWDHLLDDYTDNNSWRVREFIRDVFQPEQYLQVWESRLDELAAMRHLTDLINDYYAVLWLGFKLVGISPIHNQWIITTQMQVRLETAYFKYMNEPFSEDFSNAAEHLKWLLWYKSD